MFSEHYDISDLTNEKTDSYLIRKSHIFYTDE